MKLNWKFVLLSLIFLSALAYLLHNLIAFPNDQGYIFSLHSQYADILTSQWRLPTLIETGVAYNPPFFYLLSGLFARLVSFLAKLNFYDSLKLWPYLGTGLSLFGLFLWLRIVKKLQPQTKWFIPVFVIWTFSLPVFQKMLPMYTIEPFLLFTMALTFWYFIIIFLPQPTVKKTLCLSLLTSINVLSRLTSLVLPPTIACGILGLALVKKISWKTSLKLLTVFLFTIVLASGWFFYLRRDQRIIYSGTGGKKENISYIKYGWSFYYDIPFKFMMTYPFRMPPPNPTPLIPVYYSTFWGDYWNYYIQTRFNISQEARDNDKYIINSERLASLALQNRINLLPTLIILAGFIYQFMLILKKIPHHLNEQWLVETMFFLMTCLTWLGFLYFVTFHLSWKGDGIKACYMLYALPIFIYMATSFLLNKLKNYKIIFVPVIIWLILASGINFYWAWY